MSAAPDGRGGAATYRKDRYFMILYKYRNWPVEGENWTRQTLINNQIYASAPNDLNDPFDSKFEVFSTQFKQNINEVMYNMHVMSFIMTFLSESATRLPKSEKEKLKKKLSQCKTSAEGFHFVKSYLKEHGYCPRTEPSGVSL